jgi:hypothetical protein
VRPTTSSSPDQPFCRSFAQETTDTIGPRSVVPRLIRQHRVPICRHFEKRERRGLEPATSGMTGRVGLGDDQRRTSRKGLICRHFPPRGASALRGRANPRSGVWATSGPRDVVNQGSRPSFGSLTPPPLVRWTANGRRRMIVCDGERSPDRCRDVVVHGRGGLDAAAARARRRLRGGAARASSPRPTPSPPARHSIGSRRSYRRRGSQMPAKRLQPRPWKSSSGQHASLSDSASGSGTNRQLSDPPRELNLLLGHVARRQRTVSPQI